jgi:hypothetical protein
LTPNRPRSLEAPEWKIVGDTQHEPKERKFYGIGPNYRPGGKPMFALENKEAFQRYLRIDNSPRYSNFREKPCFLNKVGRPFRDIEGCVGHWFISDRTKAVLQ